MARPYPSSRMATALPIVVADLPGNREWVRPDANGWLARDGDASSFADALVAADALAPGARAAIGRANRAVAEARADWSIVSRRLLDAVTRLGRRAA